MSMHVLVRVSVPMLSPVLFVYRANCSIPNTDIPCGVKPSVLVPCNPHVRAVIGLKKSSESRDCTPGTGLCHAVRKSTLCMKQNSHYDTRTVCDLSVSYLEILHSKNNLCELEMHAYTCFESQKQREPQVPKYNKQGAPRLPDN